MKLEWVEICNATHQDVKDTQGSLLYRTVSYPFWLGAKAWCTIDLALNRKDLMRWDSPLPLRIVHLAQYYLGWKPEALFVIEKPTFFKGEHYQLTDAVANAEFFRQPRNDPNGVFAPGKSVTLLATFLRGCFPEHPIEKNDFIFTSNPQQTALLHKWYAKKLGDNSIKEYFGTIKAQCATFLGELQKGNTLNFSQLIPKFLAQVFGVNLLGNEAAGQELSAQILPLKELLSKQANGKLSKEEDTKLQEIAGIVRQQTLEVLKNKEFVRFFDDPQTESMTEGQKAAFIFTALFAAMDNTSNLVITAIYCLTTLEKEEFQSLQTVCREHLKQEVRAPFEYPVELEQFLAVVLRYFPPVIGVARTVNAPLGLCMKYKFQEETVVRKVVFPAGCSLSARIANVARSVDLEKSATLDEAISAFSPFGGGPQHCPGEKFALLEAKELLLQMVAQYQVTLPTAYRIHQELQVTSVIKPDVKAIIFEQ